ncbi:MAG TPA: hypothetical protein VKE70_01660 [Candidatus Solibacter sp.]|nr:hypothetical protein [Candidatus Solibacter sp.]
MSHAKTFAPFYERLPNPGLPAFIVKIAASLCLGAPFFFTASRLLGVIITAAMLALYIATAAFRNMLPYMGLKLTRHGYDELLETVQRVMSDRRFLLGAAGFGVVNVLIGAVLGPPYKDLNVVMAYIGYVFAGMTCGMPVIGIYGVVATVNRFATLKPKFDYTEPDRCGGASVFGHAVVTFSLVTLVVGVLISWYLIRTDWVNHGEAMSLLKWFWVIWPFALSLTVLAAPAGRIADLLRELAIRESGELDRRLAALTELIEDPSLDAGARDEARKSYLHYRDLRTALHNMRTSPFEPVLWGKYATIFAINFAIAWVNADLKDFKPGDPKSVLSTIMGGHLKGLLEALAKLLDAFK